ncbi:MAG: hypothetical protein R6V10_11275 [bacterium]
MKCKLTVMAGLLILILAATAYPAAGNDRSPRKDSQEKAEKKAEPLPPEKYYQLALERQELLISSYKHMIKILEFHERPLAARKDLQIHEKEKKQKLRALFEKYDTTPSEYHRSWRATEELAKRSEYLDNHPELRDKLAENSSRIRKLEEKVWKLLRPVYRRAEK